ncbi:hypothetical protein V1477_010263 [Vespula maculifrons]|uniref:Uncharacterized protein n=1 Tax=Vespula maculifrons TaxID=7453 RepID=A0ABD2C822_VESMC
MDNSVYGNSLNYLPCTAATKHNVHDIYIASIITFSIWIKVFTTNLLSSLQIHINHNVGPYAIKQF